MSVPGLEKQESVQTGLLPRAVHDADGLSVHLAGVGEEEGQLEDVVPRRSVGQHVHVATHKQLTLAHHGAELEWGGVITNVSCRIQFYESTHCY